jgi:hypothetical protein
VQVVRQYTWHGRREGDGMSKLVLLAAATAVGVLGWRRAHPPGPEGPDAWAVATGEDARRVLDLR